jgi:hypothetical protein
VRFPIVVEKHKVLFSDGSLSPVLDALPDGAELLTVGDAEVPGSAKEFTYNLLFLCSTISYSNNRYSL